MKLKFTEHQKKYMTKGAQFWVQTLYDNELDQCRDTLESGNAYCCLGVGALCYQMITGEDLPEKEDGTYDGDNLAHEFEKVRDWLGLDQPEGAPVEDPHMYYLVTLNDEKHYSFKQIAEVLLQHPEQYFVPVKGRGLC